MPNVKSLSNLFMLDHFLDVQSHYILVQLVKKLPAMRETWVQSLAWEYPLEKRKATHSSIPTWRIPRAKSMGLQRVGND